MRRTSVRTRIIAHAARDGRGGFAARLRPRVPARPDRNRPALARHGSSRTSGNGDGPVRNAECGRASHCLFELGAELADEHSDRLAPIALILQTYCRGPEGKHRCLELVAERGVALPDTPPMAMHRGRIDLLEEHLRRDPELLTRTFSHEEIYPPSLGCSADHSFALHGTPLDGTTLLHMCVDFDEIEIARWLIEHGADVNAKAEIDADGFGGHTPLFGCVVSQVLHLPTASGMLPSPACCWIMALTRTPARRCASGCDSSPDETMHEYRDVTPLSWGERFHGPGSHGHTWVSEPAMQADRGARGPTVTSSSGRNRKLHSTGQSRAAVATCVHRTCLAGLLRAKVRRSTVCVIVLCQRLRQ